MDWLVQIIVWLQGKKTYLVAVSAILTALIAYLNSSISLSELIAAIYGAITAITIKAGQARGVPPTSTSG
jgi:hypothetical protein